MLWGEPGASAFLGLGHFRHRGISAEDRRKATKRADVAGIPETNRETALRSTLVLMVGIGGVDFSNNAEKFLLAVG